MDYYEVQTHKLHTVAVCVYVGGSEDVCLHVPT